MKEEGEEEEEMQSEMMETQRGKDNGRFRDDLGSAVPWSCSVLSMT